MLSWGLKANLSLRIFVSEFCVGEVKASEMSELKRKDAPVHLNCEY